MKHVLIIPDGCADEPLDVLDGKTPLGFASTPNMDRIRCFSAFRRYP